MNLRKGLVIVFFIQVYLGFLMESISLIYLQNSLSELTHSSELIVSRLVESYSTEEGARETLDLLQNTFNCCGITADYKEWTRIGQEMARFNKSYDVWLPQSCCRQPSENCTADTHLQ
ncbi:hypothetical protein Ciccas_012248, partial [Cichlidogyrus casuarinus]